GFTVASSAELQAKLDARARKTSPFAGVPRDISRKAHWVEAELVGEIAFTEFTPDGILRHPSFLGLREDKPARQISREKPVPATPKPATTRGKAKPTPSVELTNEAGIAAAEQLGVRLTSHDRVVYPGLGVTKAQVVA